MATPDIVPSSPEGQALQAAIQKQLASLGWSTEDDTVMAEYCLVMLGNRKTADQISTELSDLIGGDFDASFVSWLFTEVKKHYPPAPSSPPSAPTGPAATTQGGANGVPARPSGPVGGGRIFGAAAGGVKRDARDMEGAGQDGRAQRQRTDVPSGPRGAGPRSLFDRVNGNNPQFAPGRTMGPVNNTGMPQPAFDAITQTVQAILSGAHPSVLANIPFPALAAHPSANLLPPHIMAQAQANAVAQAQALATMQNVWNAPPGALAGAGAFGAVATGLASGFNPAATAFQPSFANPTSPARPQKTRSAAPPVALPSKPEKEDICKHGVDCTKAQCPFSHPSPVATKESGLVLSSAACEKQLKCEDADCPKSHVSRAQLVAPSSAVSSAAAPAASTRAAPPSATAATQGTPCKFGAQCTRPGCYFVHPWDVNGVPNGPPGGMPCRYGASCTRPDCHFTHPASRSAPFSRTKSGQYTNKTASFSGPAGAKKAQQESGIGSWPSESKEHVSERLKRFSGGEAGKDGQGEGTEGVERIVPGQKQQQDGKDGEAKVEIHFSDDEEEQGKKEVKSEGEKPAVAA
ncbi:hypothetical protein JCM11641_007200 [Rhodosporidiobolus odoratus]